MAANAKEKDGHAEQPPENCLDETLLQQEEIENSEKSLSNESTLLPVLDAEGPMQGVNLLESHGSNTASAIIMAHDTEITSIDERYASGEIRTGIESEKERSIGDSFSERHSISRSESEPRAIFASEEPSEAPHYTHRSTRKNFDSECGKDDFEVVEKRRTRSQEYDAPRCPASDTEDSSASGSDEENGIDYESKYKEILEAYKELAEEHDQALKRFEKARAIINTSNSGVSGKYDFDKAKKPGIASRTASSFKHPKRKATIMTRKRRTTIQNPLLVSSERDAILAIGANATGSSRRKSIHGFSLGKYPEFLHAPPLQKAGSVGSVVAVSEETHSPRGPQHAARLNVKPNQFGPNAPSKGLKLRIESGYTMIVTEDSDGDEEEAEGPGQSSSDAEKRSSSKKVSPAPSTILDDPEKPNQEENVDENAPTNENGRKQSKLIAANDAGRNSGSLVKPRGKKYAVEHEGEGIKRKKKKRDWVEFFFGSIPVIHPESSFRARWNLTVLFMLLWYSFTVPFSIAFSTPPEGWWLALENIFDAMFAIDILLNFVTGYYSKNNSVNFIIMNRRMIVYKYITTWLVVDLLSIVPFDKIAMAVTASGSESGLAARVIKLIRLLKLFRLLRLVGLMRYWKYYSERLKPGMLRLLTSMMIGLLTIHFLACVFYLISDLDPTSVDTWSDAYGVRQSGSTMDKYVVSLYWSITTMTTVGYGDIVPKNTIEVAFVILAMLISCSMFAYFVGNMAHIIASVDSTQTVFKERMEFVREYMTHQDLPIELQGRIKAYYVHCWKNLKSFPFSEDAILEDLSPALRREVVLFLNREMVEKVPFFRGQDESFICKLILSMTSEVCAPLDFVIRQGEAGKCMFFLRRGLVEVCNYDASEVYTTLGDSSYFGEVSLLVGGRRTASVRAIFHCSLLRLEQEELDDILLDYPDAMKQIVKLAATSKYQLTDDERLSLQERFEIFHGVQTESIASSNATSMIPETPTSPLEGKTARSEPETLRAVLGDSRKPSRSLSRSSTGSVRRHVPLGNHILNTSEKFKILEERRSSLRRADSRKSKSAKLVI